MKFNIELDGTEAPAEVERLVAALVVLYDLQPSTPQLSVTSTIGAVSDAAAVEAHILGNGPAQAATPEPPLPPITTTRPPAPPMGSIGLVSNPIDKNCTVQDADGSIIDTAALGFGATHGSPELDEDARKLAALGADPGPAMRVPPPPPPPPADDVDSAGVRWDAAKHTANRSKKGDGTWKAKPGLSKEAVAEAGRVANIPPPPPSSVQGAPEDPVELFEWADKQGVTIARLQAAFKAVGLVDANGEGSIPLLLSRPEFTAAVYEELSK